MLAARAREPVTRSSPDPSPLLRHNLHLHIYSHHEQMQYQDVAGRNLAATRQVVPEKWIAVFEGSGLERPRQHQHQHHDQRRELIDVSGPDERIVESGDQGGRRSI